MKSEKILQAVIRYFESDARRVNHTLKVYRFAKNIGTMEGLKDDALLILELASILHCIGIKESEKKYGSSDPKYQKIEGSIVAEELMRETDLSEEIKKRVGYLIRNHHSYDKIDNLDFQILVEAHFLAIIQEYGMATDQINSIKSKYFKTPTGIEYLNNLYIKNDLS